MTDTEFEPWVNLCCAIVRQAQRDAKKGDSSFVQDDFGFIGSWAKSADSPPTKFDNRHKLSPRRLA